MSDRAPLSIELAACPPESREAFAGVLDEYGIDSCDGAAGILDEYGRAWNPDDVFAGLVYSTDEISLGYDDTIAAALAEIPGVVARVHQDAKYEYDGMTHYVVAGEPVFTSLGTQDGDAFLTVGEVDRIIGEWRADEADAAQLRAAGDFAPTGLEPLDVRLERATGKTQRGVWEQAWREAATTFVIVHADDPRLRWSEMRYDYSVTPSPRLGPGWVDTSGSTYVREERDRYGALPDRGQWAERTQGA